MITYGILFVELIMGGPPVRTPEKLDLLAEYRLKKASFSLIAGALEVNENTLKSWSRRKDYKLLFARKSLDLLMKLTGKNIDSDNPKDAQWLLERLFREEYCPPTQKSENKNSNEMKVVELHIVDATPLLEE